MENSLQHQMVLEKTLPSGEEEWFCPTCGRRFLMSWPPNFKRPILEPGDESAPHSGGKSLPGLELNLSSPGSTPANPEDQENLAEEDQPVDETWLKPWQDWMDITHFEDLWNEQAR